MSTSLSPRFYLRGGLPFAVKPVKRCRFAPMEGSSAALQAVFERVHPPSTFEETVERLGTAIRSGLLPPGSRLPAAREPAEQPRIPRPTLRQALTTLVQSGDLVPLRRRRGGACLPAPPPPRPRQPAPDRRHG